MTEVVQHLPKRSWLERIKVVATTSTTATATTTTIDDDDDHDSNDREYHHSNNKKDSRLNHASIITTATLQHEQRYVF